jgi:hypothetical protein
MSRVQPTNPSDKGAVVTYARLPLGSTAPERAAVQPGLGRSRRPRRRTDWLAVLPFTAIAIFALGNAATAPQMPTPLPSAVNGPQDRDPSGEMPTIVAATAAIVVSEDPNLADFTETGVATFNDVPGPAGPNPPRPHLRQTATASLPAKPKAGTPARVASSSDDLVRIVLWLAQSR